MIRISFRRAKVPSLAMLQRLRREAWSSPVQELLVDAVSCDQLAEWKQKAPQQVQKNAKHLNAKLIQLLFIVYRVEARVVPCFLDALIKILLKHSRLNCCWFKILITNWTKFFSLLNLCHNSRFKLGCLAIYVFRLSSEMSVRNKPSVKNQNPNDFLSTYWSS